MARERAPLAAPPPYAPARAPAAPLPLVRGPVMADTDAPHESDWQRWAEHWDAELQDFRAFILPVFARHGFGPDAALAAFYSIGDPLKPFDDEED